MAWLVRIILQDERLGCKTETISLPTLTFTPIPDTATPTLTLIPDTPTPILFQGKDGMTMGYVPAGMFLMGSDADGRRQRAGRMGGSTHGGINRWQATW
jgi:hypothetical protein